MSGRLVILRHKSWHVWNQDNREKVLRDERIDREAEEAKKELENKSIQEKTMEILRTGTNAEEKLQIPTNESVPQPPTEPIPFRLFEDLEQKEANVLLGHPDYLKEKAEKERKLKQKEGVADWALGEGSFESKGIVPWYQRSDKHSSVSHITTKQIDKDNVRKFTQDPMAKFIHHDDSIPESKEDSTLASSTLPIPSLTNQQHENQKRLPELPTHSNPLIDISNEDEKKSQKKSTKKSSHKKHKKSHKKHHKHHKDSSNDTSSTNSSHDSNSSDSDNEDTTIEQKKHKKRKIKDERTVQTHQLTATPVTTGGYINGISIEELRKKRLEREKNEEKRVARVLAKADVYGHPAAALSGGVGDSEYSRRYHQQYNPTIARPAQTLKR